MSEESSFEVREHEKTFLDKERESHPELFEREVSIDSNELLQNVGIEGVFGERPLGHIKLFPEDFIVEEVSRDGTIHTIDATPQNAPEKKHSGDEETKTVWADLIKMGMDSIEVVNEIARQLGIDKKHIGIAGIKDKHALTGQWISFRGTSEEAVRRTRAENFFLKNISGGKGALQTGDLAGNRFTIVLRTQEPIDRTELETQLRDLEEQGFWNFFYLQRFGNPRLLSHKLGILLLQGKFEDVVRTSFTGTSHREALYFQQVRSHINEVWGDWKGIADIIEPLSYSFKSEQKMLFHLMEKPGDFVGALNQVPEQVKLWVYAYASYLFNKTLSTLIAHAEEIPLTLPLALSPTPYARELYDPFFKAHTISPFFPTLRYFPYVQKQEKEIETLKKFSLKGIGTTKEGVIIDFTLDKGSYATTFLSHAFILSSGTPLPEGISIAEVDAKKALGTGTIAPLREGVFKKVFDMRHETGGLLREQKEE